MRFAGGDAFGSGGGRRARGGGGGGGEGSASGVLDLCGTWNDLRICPSCFMSAWVCERCPYKIDAYMD